MVSNPMQRKSKNSFILGLVLGLFIVVAVAAIFIMRIRALNDKVKKLEGDRRKVYVLNQDVKSGELIADDDIGSVFKQIEVDVNTIPKGATTNLEKIQSYSSVDEDGNRILTLVDTSGQKNKYVEIDGERYLLTDKDGKYFANINNEEKEIKLQNTALVAKIDMNKNTIVTASMFALTDDFESNDLRYQEYNIISLTSKIKDGSYIDIRLRLPNGLDYIVVSKKRVEIPQVEGMDNTIWLKMTEAETLIMSEAIVESYMLEGSMLYATEYVTPGTQESAVPTFVANESTINLIQTNQNIVQEAKTEIRNRYDSDRIGTRNRINTEITNADKATDNAISKTQAEITTRQSMRKSYLESLAGN